MGGGREKKKLNESESEEIIGEDATPIDFYGRSTRRLRSHFLARKLFDFYRLSAIPSFRSGCDRRTRYFPRREY